MDHWHFYNAQCRDIPQRFYLGAHFRGYFGGWVGCVYELLGINFLGVVEEDERDKLTPTIGQIVLNSLHHRYHILPNIELKIYWVPTFSEWNVVCSYVGNNRHVKTILRNIKTESKSSTIHTNRAFLNSINAFFGWRLERNRENVASIRILNTFVPFGCLVNCGREQCGHRNDHRLSCSVPKLTYDFAMQASRDSIPIKSL